MAGSTTTTIQGLLKRVYDDENVKNLQNMAAETFPKLKKSGKKPTGLGVFGGSLYNGNQQGQGSQNELEALRTPDVQTTGQWTVTPKVFTHTIRLSGLSMEIAKGNEDSFADNLTFQMDNGLKDSAKELNAQCFRDGSGKIAQVNGAIAPSTALVFDNGVPTHFRVGMKIDVINAGVKEIDGVEVTDVNFSTNTLTIASSTCTDDMYIYRAGTYDNAPTDGKEIAGFPRITDDGSDFATYEGVIRTGAGYVPSFKGLEIAAGGANLSDDLLQRAVSQGKVYCGATYKKVISNTSQMRKYLVLTLPSVSWEQGKGRDTGSKSIESLPTWAGKQWILDTDCGFDEVYMYDPELVQRFDVYDLRFDSTDGKVLKWDSGYDGFVAYAKYYGNVGTPHPKGAMIRITGLATPTF